jgi:Ni,Fe-hydrogenase I large subunit
MARTRVVVDPITRIEGHLRIEAQAEDGRIADAWASSTQFRGIETIMQGRDPRDAWAFTQRICGVCTVVHAVASCRAVEDALDIRIPPNANLIRNLIHGMQFVQDHVIHFYHLHALDWVDVVSALDADPADTARIAASLSPWPNNSATYFLEVQNRLRTFVQGGQLGIFTNGYWGHPAYKLPAPVNLLAVAHYLEALDWQRDVVRLHTIFGGKNPHPNFLVGGMASAINLDDTATINAERLTDIHALIKRARRFVEEVYWIDLIAIAGFYKEWAAIGGGTPNYLAVGEFPDGDVRDIDSLYFPRGIILDNDLSQVHPYDQSKVEEFIHSSWYEYSGGDDVGLHPWEGETTPRYTGPEPPWEYLQDHDKYTWMKAPRYEGRAMPAPDTPMSRSWLTRYSVVLASVQPRCSPPWAAPRPGESRRCCSPDEWSIGTTAWSTASATATPRPLRETTGIRGVGRRRRAGTVTSTLPGERWDTGSISRTGASAGTSAWSPAPGTALPGTARDRWDPTKHPW